MAAKPKDTKTWPQGDCPGGQFVPLRSCCVRVKTPSEQLGVAGQGGCIDGSTPVRSKVTVPKGPGWVINATIGGGVPKIRSLIVPVNVPSVKTEVSDGPLLKKLLLPAVSQ